MNVGASGHLDDTAWAVWSHDMFFFCCFITSEDVSSSLSLVWGAHNNGEKNKRMCSSCSWSTVFTKCHSWFCTYSFYYMKLVIKSEWRSIGLVIFWTTIIIQSRGTSLWLLHFLFSCEHSKYNSLQQLCHKFFFNSLASSSVLAHIFRWCNSILKEYTFLFVFLLAVISQYTYFKRT